jgi:hypothetical protein
MMLFWGLSFHTNVRIILKNIFSMEKRSSLACVEEKKFYAIDVSMEGLSLEDRIFFESCLTQIGQNFADRGPMV